MSETKTPIRSLNGHALVDEQARADVKALNEEIGELTKPMETTSGHIVQFVSDGSSPIIVEAGAEVMHAGRNLFEVGKTINDYVQSKHLLSVNPSTQTMHLKMSADSDTRAIRGVKIPFANGMSIRVAAECVGESYNPVIPILRVKSADGADVTSGVTGVYNSTLGAFLPENFWVNPPPASFTFACSNDLAAYCYVGVQLRSDKGIAVDTEVDVRVMAEIGDYTDTWEAGFLRAYTPVSGLVEIQPVSGLNSIYADDQSVIIVSSGTSQLVQSVNNKRGKVVLNAKDVGAVNAKKHAELVYNTVAEMLNDEELPVGKGARTLGYYSAGDGGAASYTVEDRDNGYGLAAVNGYCNIVAEKRMSPKMFGAVANGDYVNTDDTAAFQACLDFCAGRYIVDVTDGCYVISGVKLYHGKTYDMIGGNRQANGIINNLPSNIIVKHGSDVGFVGSNELGADDSTGLPIITLNMRDVRINGYYRKGSGFPIFVKDVWLKNSRIDNVYASGLGCFVEAIMTSFSSVSNCDITVSDCAFRNNYIFKGFVDCAFYSNYFMGITKFSDGTLFKPVVFEARGFYTIQFSSNFIGGMWAVVGCKKVENATYGEILGWWSRDNVYSCIVEFATAKDDITHISVGDIKLFADQVWNCSKHSLVDTAEGKSFFDDLDGNTRIEGNKATFFNFFGITSGTFRDIVVRFCDPLFPEEMVLKKVTISNPVYLFAPDGHDFSESEHVFDTKIPLSNFNDARDTDYKYTRIEPWNNRVVDELPVIQDTNYRYVLEGQTCYYNNKLLTCRGDSWYDAMGNVVTA